jgi:transposase InsO family protein
LRPVAAVPVNRLPHAPQTTRPVNKYSELLVPACHRPRFLIRDRDTEFVAGFDAVFTGDGTQIIRTPVVAPNANAYAERWVSTARSECLDWILICGERHFSRVLAEYIEQYNHARPHRSRDLRSPYTSAAEPPSTVTVQPIRRRGRLEGLLHEYDLAAA